MDTLQQRLERAALIFACGASIAPIISIAAAQILLGLALATIVLSRMKMRAVPGWQALVFFCLWTVVSLAACGHFREGMPQIRKFYVFLSLVVFATAINKLSQLRTSLALWVAAGTASAVWALIQFPRKWFSAAHGGGDPYREYLNNRITGFMSHWMTFGGLVSIVFVVALAWLLFGAESKRIRMALAAALAVMGVALALSFTRGVWLGACCGALYLLWSWRKASILVLPVVFVAVFAVAPPLMRERITSMVRPHGEVDSNLHRVATRRIGWEMIKAHPLVGVGPMQVDRQYKAYVPADIKTLPEGYYGHLHNIYIHYAAERGLPAAVALTAFALYALWVFLRGAPRATQATARFVLYGTAAAVIVILATGAFEHNLGDSEVLQLFLAAIAFGYKAAEA